MQNEWKKPSFVEIPMNAEIGSYQPDFEEAPRADDDGETSEAASEG